MSNVTIADVRRVAAHVGEMYRQQGGLSFPVLNEGSKHYGRAYRLMTIDAGTSGEGTPREIRSWPSDGYLGMTKREAYERLIILKAAFYDIGGDDFDHEDIDAAGERAEKLACCYWRVWSDVAPWELPKD